MTNKSAFYVLLRYQSAQCAVLPNGVQARLAMTVNADKDALIPDVPDLLVHIEFYRRDLDK